MLRAAKSCLALIAVSQLGCAGRAVTAASSSASELLAPEQVVTVGVVPLDCGVRLSLAIAPGYHIMSDQPSAPNFIATRVTLESSDLHFETPIYPPAVPYAFAEHSIATFRGVSEVFARCATESNAVAKSSADVALVAVTLRYQACTESFCLFPVTRHFSTRIALRPRKYADFSAL
jgi:hypothetical protein